MTLDPPRFSIIRRSQRGRDVTLSLTFRFSHFHYHVNPELVPGATAFSYSWNLNADITPLPSSVDFSLALQNPSGFASIEIDSNIAILSLGSNPAQSLSERPIHFPKESDISLQVTSLHSSFLHGGHHPAAQPSRVPPLAVLTSSISVQSESTHSAD